MVARKDGLPKKARQQRINLTPSELMFADYLLFAPNPTKTDAAKFAGYTGSAVKETARQLAKRPQVIAYMQAKRESNQAAIAFGIEYCMTNVFTLPQLAGRLAHLLYSDDPRSQAIGANGLMRMYGVDSLASQAVGGGIKGDGDNAQGFADKSVNNTFILGDDLATQILANRRRAKALPLNSGLAEIDGVIESSTGAAVGMISGVIQREVVTGAPGVAADIEPDE